MAFTRPSAHEREITRLQQDIENLHREIEARTAPAADMAMDQPPDVAGWYRVRTGLWRNRLTGEVWRGWQQYGTRAGHYPGADWARSAARESRAAESQYRSQLRQIGRQIGDMVRGVFDPDNVNDPGWDTILDMLARYRDMLRPWAQATAQRMLSDVARRDASSWHRLGQQVHRALKAEVERAPTQDAIRDLYQYQVEQILKLADDAADRIRQSRAFSAEIVRQMRGPAEEAMVAGTRWEDLTQYVRNTGLDVQSSAETVARTETARAHSTLQAVRAKHIGSELFQWKTANDLEVRDLHRELSRRNVGYGTGIYRWDDPPELDDGRPGLPGSIYNCRCYAMPILPALD